jgi:ERCC4-type nuclease
MLTVVIDIRERELWELLEPWYAENSEGWIAVKKPLDVGDISFSIDDQPPLVVLERKSAEDFGASLADGRYREQRARLLSLRGQGASIGYIVEVPPWSPTLTRTWCRGSFNEIQLQQSIIRLQFRYTIPVFQAASPKETVHWIRRIAKQLVADANVFRGGLSEDRIQVAAAYKDAIHTKKASNNTQEIVFQSMLQTVPGLGKAAVDAIAAATASSFQTLLFMSVDDLAAIDTGKRKLGLKLATALHNVLHT